MVSAVFLADKLALEVLHANLTQAYNRAEFDGLVDYFTDNVKWRGQAVECHGASSVTGHLIQTRILQPASRWIYAAPRIFILKEGRASGASTCIEIYTDLDGQHLHLNDVDDEYALGSDKRWRVSSRVARPV